MSTGYVYDPIFLKHTQRGHPESARRLEAIIAELTDTGLLDQLHRVPSRPATSEELERVHTKTYIEQVRKLSASGGGYLDPDTYVNRYTYDAALVAAGSLIALTQAVIAGTVRNGFAIVRPPGHHALSFHGMGFCIFNNIVLAARAALDGEGLRRVAIVDFDVHHGNATQAQTEADPRILFISTHQYPHYPGTGRLDEIGQGEGRGTVINLPLQRGVGDHGFAQLYRDIVTPALRRFRPDLILVSAGYDAHWDDPLAGLGLSLKGYAHLAQTLISLADALCDGRIVFTLEGGYQLPVLRRGVANAIRAMLGRDAFDDPLGPSPYPEPDLTDYIARVRQRHHLTAEGTEA